jgi:hypothetical protein
MDEMEFAARSYGLLKHFLSPGSPLDPDLQVILAEFLAVAPESIAKPGDAWFKTTFEG